MYLERLEVQGFKTFAQKTVLKFPKPNKERHSVTSIVGPNGSGKSNLSDAIRWALGEQSLKILRGKKSEDIIFSGSIGRARAGFAEVSLTFNNEGGVMPIDFKEVTITRKLHRDGTSAYLINGQGTRLSDIHLLLAQANVGQRSYSVIGQGMVDHILVATPEERKVFFDDATGVRQFQLKRHEAMLKLKRTYENLTEVELVLNEIAPRLRSLKRQVNRLEKREQIESELANLQHNYYSTLWSELQTNLKSTREKFNQLDAKYRAAENKLKSFERKSSEMEEQEGLEGREGSEGLARLQNEYRRLQAERSKMRDKEFEIQKQIELKKVQAEAKWTPLPLPDIIKELESITADLESLKSIESLESLGSYASSLHDRSNKLLGRLKKPAPETIKPDPGLMMSLKETEQKRTDLESELKRLDKAIESYAETEKKQRSELFELGRQMRTKQNELNTLGNERNTLQIELARLEEREANLNREMHIEMKERANKVKAGEKFATVDTNAIFGDLTKLKQKLDLIGGIDPETIQEYEEIKDRHDFLDAQVNDLKGAIKSTEKIIDELDAKIKKQSEEAFKHINREFQRYFKLLFGGGSCSLVKLTRNDLEVEKESVEASEGVSMDRTSHETAEEARKDEEADIERVKERIKGKRDAIIGVDIHATPPGKKIKALNLLSGGERSLTSIALLAAIMAINPSPFIVLDEVDAALDESNTLRFATILEDLAQHTQFIVITHNRATMEKSDVLYGVTMGDDGVSHLLSVNLEELPKTTARH